MFINKRTAVILTAIFSIIYFSGCATARKSQGSFYKTAQTHLTVESKPSGKVYVNNKYVGKSPIEIPLVYSRKVEKMTRNVSYWHNQPGWSLFITIISLGTYLPFSAIPVDSETTLETLDSFKDNGFTIEIEAEGFQRWQNEVTCKGEESITLQPILIVEAANQTQKN